MTIRAILKLKVIKKEVIKCRVIKINKSNKLKMGIVSLIYVRTI